MNTGEAALCAAVQQGHIEIARALLDMGSPATFSIHSGDTPLSIAKKNKDSAMIALLEKSGPRIPSARTD